MESSMLGKKDIFKKIKNAKKITDDSETGFNSVELDTSTNFMEYNAGKYVE